MPIYEYQCSACGHEMEKLQKISDPLLTECPSCGQSTLAKQVSKTGFRLMGEGWYETDFKSVKKRVPDESTPTGSAGESVGQSGKTTEAVTPSTSKTETASSTTKDE